MVNELKHSSVKMKSEEVGNWSEIVEQPVPSLSLQERTWKYRGEGNANLVIALPEERFILRLHKWERGKEVTADAEKEEKERGWRETIFCRTVMVPLLGSAYIQSPVPARINQSELVDLDKVLVPLRPANRNHKGIKFGHVTIYPDYALLPLHLKKVAKDFDNVNSRPTIGTKTITPENSENSTDLHQEKTCYSSHDPKNSASINETKNCLELQTHSLENFDSINNGSQDNICNTASQHCICAKSRPFLVTTADQMENPVFCVEIKPKQGWIPFIDRCNPKCTFCLTQYLKLSKETIDGISQYCPLDLFSGNEVRMKKALKSLLSTPQNNLKIFKDGHLVYSDNARMDLMALLKEWFMTSSSDFTLDDSDGLVEKFCDLVYQALTKDLTDGELPPVVKDLPGTDPFKDEDGNILPASPLITSTPFFGFSQSCDWSSQPLPSNCILDRILKIQQLQQYGVEAVYQMYRKLTAEESDYSYVNRLCHQPNPEELMLDPVQRCLLATTAKDCSILIAFQLVTNWERRCETRNLMDIDGESYIWNIGVSDLDPKPLSCIEKHRKRDMDVITSCIKYLNAT